MAKLKHADAPRALSDYTDDELAAEGERRAKAKLRQAAQRRYNVNKRLIETGLLAELAPKFHASRYDECTDASPSEFTDEESCYRCVVLKAIGLFLNPSTRDAAMELLDDFAITLNIQHDPLPPLT